MTMENEDEYKEAVEELRVKVDKYPDFPKKGILFYDFFSLMYEHPTRHTLLRVMIHLCDQKFKGKFNAIAGLDARGLMIGFYLAHYYKVKYIGIRKPNKLPGKCVSAEFMKEYGPDTVEMQEKTVDQDSQVLIVDDLLATGGTLKGAETVVQAAGGNVAGYFVVFTLTFLKGWEKLKYPENFASIMMVED